MKRRGRSIVCPNTSFRVQGYPAERNRLITTATLSFESASEAERRERLGPWVGDISLMPDGTLDGFNYVLDFDEDLTQVFRVPAIMFLRQSFHDAASVRNLSISCCDQHLNVLVILSHRVASF